MSAVPNILTIVGNLTGDPELRHTQDGTAVANFSVASTPRVPDGNGGFKDGETVFWRISAWRKLAENVKASLAKGDRVVVIGEDTICFWESDHGLLNTVADNDNPLTVAEGDDEIEAAVLEWGEAVHRRIDDLAYNITVDAVTPNTAKLIELALRSTPDSEPPTRGAKFLAAQARVAEAKLLEQRLAAAAIADEILAVYPQASTLVLAEDDGDGGGVWVAAGIQSVNGESIDDTEAVLDDLWAEVNALPTSTPHSIEAETGAALDISGFEWFEDARGARGGDPSAVYINLPLAKSQVI